MHKNRWVERAKNVLIALLAVILLALTVLALPVKTVTDTPWLAALVRPFASLMGISQGDLTDTPMADAGSVTGAVQPVSVSVRTPAGRTSFQYSFSTLDASFEQFGAALGQALETAQETERTSTLRVQEALGKTSVAFCYPGEISSKLAASWLHVDTDLDTQSRWLILAGDGVYVTLYLVGEELFSCQTQMRAESLEQLLQSCTPDGSFFAFEDAQSRFDTLAPLSLLPGQTPAIHEASAANPCDARFSDALASSLGFNPYGDARYTDDAGNTTYTETGYALSISAAGELTLRADGQVTRFRAASGEEAERLVLPGVERQDRKGRTQKVRPRVGAQAPDRLIDARSQNTARILGKQLASLWTCKLLLQTLKGSSGAASLDSACPAFLICLDELPFAGVNALAHVPEDV